jgi:aminoacyl tRNA synthase complex-interacting multifunctional protein 1
MALEVALSKLASPVKDLALSVTQNASLYVGESDKDKAEVVGWIERVAQGDLVKEDALKVR